MFRNPSTDLIVILVIVLLIFGPKRLPGLGRQLGQGMREFKDSITGESKDDEEERPAISAGNSEPVPTQPVQQAPAQPVQAQQAPPQQAPAADRSSAEVGSERNS
jgi:sec-independent protein translocase protein TatA